MEVGSCVKKYAVVISVITILIATLGNQLQASQLPWETENSVKNALSQQDGQSIVCEATVARIAARNNPDYFVIQDDYSGNRLVVLCHPPEDLSVGKAVYVEGTIGTLTANGERYVYDPTVYGYIKDGELQHWTPFFGFAPTDNKQELTFPTDPIPPSDPSLADDGLGIAGEVTADTTYRISKFDTVASLRATSPPILTPVKITCKPVTNVGENYIYVGDDNSSAVVRVYTNVIVKPTDRVIELTGTVHTENGALVIYADSGPDPYFDPQGSNGSVSVASTGTVAYAGTLNDANDTTNAGGISVMSTSSTPVDGDWVYLTGQIVTYMGRYYSYNQSTWIDVFNIQGLDCLPGIRVWRTSSSGLSSICAIVDVMAQVNTMDGQRILGLYNTSDDSSSIECKNLDQTGTVNISPLGMNNRALGGSPLGSNPGISNAYGPYNIGSYVTVWGKVLEIGDNYYLDQSNTTPYMRIDDGSNLATGNSSYGTYGEKGVTVFADTGYGISTGDCVSITGVCSVWKPENSSTSYPCIWSSDSPVSSYAMSAITDAGTGTISGNVKLYDMPESQAIVTVYCSDGQIQKLAITRQSDNSGSNSYSFTVTKYSEYPKYMVSAECDGYKTRTYTNIEPDTTRNLYLTKLRKIYLRANSTSIVGCSGTTNVTATVVDSGHNPVAGVQVRFRTDKGSFSDSSVIHESPSAATDSSGQVTVPFYSVASEYGDATVEATDDSAPLTGDVLTDDTYKYDWEQVSNQYGQPIYITINQPSASLELTADPTAISPCGGDMSEITATLKACGDNGLDGIDVRFYTDKGVFSETGTTEATVRTSNGGIATVHLDASSASLGKVTINAYAMDNPQKNATVYVSIINDILRLTADPYSVLPTDSNSTITAKLIKPDGTPIEGTSISFTKTAGNLSVTTGTTNSNGEVTTTLSGVSQGSFAVVEATTTNRCAGTFAQRCQVDFLLSEADDWPMFMHDTRHQGYALTGDSCSITSFGSPVWTKPIDTATSSVARSDWATSGHPNPGMSSFFIWDTYVFEHPYIDSSPVQAAGCPVIVGAWFGGTDSYLSGSCGYIAAFNTTTGDLQWDYPAGAYSNAILRLSGGIASTPAVATVGDQKYVYFGCMDGNVYCLNAITGAYVWSHQTTRRDGTTAARIIQSPVVCNGVVYIGNESAKVYALNASNGNEVWTSPFEIPTSELIYYDTDDIYDITGVSSIAVANIGGADRLYFGSDAGYLYCVDASTKTQVWSYRPDRYGCIESSPTIYAGNVYFGITFYTGKNLYAANASTGEPVWSVGLDGGYGEEVRATCAAMDNGIFVGEDTGNYFYRVNAQTGAKEPMNLNNPLDAYYGNYFVGSAAFTSAGYGIVGNDNGKLYAIDKDDMNKLAECNTAQNNTSTNSFVCSSPAISYAAESGYKWIYVVSRAGNGRGTLYAFKQAKN
ncbi:MAG: PQQ-binding-like beta-propeller repeat protein [Armatimonadota bacterium]